MIVEVVVVVVVVAVSQPRPGPDPGPLKQNYGVVRSSEATSAKNITFCRPTNDVAVVKIAHPIAARHLCQRSTKDSRHGCDVDHRPLLESSTSTHQTALVIQQHHQRGNLLHCKPSVKQEASDGEIQKIQ